MTEIETNPLYIVGFNGPPKSGKDTIALALREILCLECDIPNHLHSLATPMREIAMGFCGVRTYGEYNRVKDGPQERLGGQTIREFMIGFSEDFIKPRYGHGFWGKTLIMNQRWIGKIPGLILISDVGFPAEVEEFEKITDPKNILLVKTHRPETDWVNDSRRYVDNPRVHNLTVLNDRTPLDAASGIVDFMHHIQWNLDCKA